MFELQFDPDDLPKQASRYDTSLGDAIMALAPCIHKKGHLTQFTIDTRCSPPILPLDSDLPYLTIPANLQTYQEASQVKLTDQDEK